MSNVPPRRPLVGLVACYAVGTWCGLSGGVTFAWATVSSCLLLLLALCRSRFRTAAALAAVASLGCAAAALNIDTGAGTRYGPLPETGEVIEMVAVVTDDPCDTARLDTSRNSTRFTVQTVQLRQAGNGKWASARLTCVVHSYGGLGNCRPRYGEKWYFKGTACRPRHKGRAQLYLDTHTTASELLSEGHGSSVVKWCYERRRSAASLLATGIDDFPAQVSLLRAIVLGYRHNLPAETRTAFADTGTLHVFAISGLHVGMIAVLVVFVLSALKIPRTRWVFIVAPVLISYTIATGMRASALRACIMATTYLAAPALGRKADALSALALAALLILAASPSQLFDTGFIYSFVVVAGLIVLYPLFAGPLYSLCAADPLRVQPESPWIAGSRAVARAAVSLVAVSCSAWLVSTPLTAYFFGQICPVALLSNLVVIPVAFLVVLSGCLSIALGSCVEFLADMFNHASLVFVALLTGTMDAMSRIPLATIRTGPMPAGIVIAWYAALAAAAAWVRRRVRQHAVPL